MVREYGPKGIRVLEGYELIKFFGMTALHAPPLLDPPVRETPIVKKDIQPPLLEFSEETRRLLEDRYPNGSFFEIPPDITLQMLLFSFDRFNASLYIGSRDSLLESPPQSLPTNYQEVFIPDVRQWHFENVTSVDNVSDVEDCILGFARELPEGATIDLPSLEALAFVSLTHQKRNGAEHFSRLPYSLCRNSLAHGRDLVLFGLGSLTDYSTPIATSRGVVYLDSQQNNPAVIAHLVRWVIPKPTPVPYR